ncbi:cleavage stimulation factor subunit 77 isoform X2 [Punica granatum]|uniref:Cleavage stimulation factor subunit 77 isoform X2 n=1 Tax=Punica granatum TaxID=22663 RepID=A0A6P8BPP9_PUNGR|nr:cleavage stimulation factor subunit 77 isoform X2 [Punica granatum]
MASVENPGGPESKDQEAAADDPPVDKYNVEAAEALASEVLRLPIAEAVPIYEQLLGVFPTCAKYWKQYVEAHMAANNDDATRLIFSRCLLNCLQVPLWRCYIRYIRKINDKKGLEGHEETRKAFLFMLNYVGGDMAAGPVWMEYIAFLKSLPEEMQWMAWKRLLAFEKGNPQRIDAASANKRIEFTYEQCLMYLYHYPDIWYDYATWHAKSGSTDAAIKVFQRALKALPESELLRYAYLELEESRGATPEAKQVYESLFTDGTRNTSLAQIQYIRFLRRTEGVEAARKYFLDARKSPNCTYHVYVAYAMIAFCLDKEPKMAHNVFEAGLKRFMNEPAYILEYADFLSRLNDDKNIRALFERALSSLPAEGSVEVWKRFVEFEQTYGDLASMLKVEQRRKEALSGTTEDEASALEGSLQDIVSRYRFMDLWPCSSQELDHLSRQEWLTRNFNKKSDKLAVSNGAGLMERGLLGPSTSSSDVIYPDTSQMVVYDPRQKTGMPTPMATGPAVAAPSNITNPVPVGVGGNITNAFDEILKATPQALAAFLATLPAVEGPTPDVDIVLSICLQSNIPAAPIGKPGAPQKQSSTGPALSGSEVSTSSKSHPVRSGSSFKQTGDRQAKKRKDLNRQEDEETTTVQSQPLPRDVFRMRQIQKARAATSSQTGSASYGSAFSGDLSGSTG